MDAEGLEEDFALQAMDDLLEEADNIDLDEDLNDQDVVQQSRMSLRFTMALGPSAGSTSGPDVGLAKDGADFKMNSCIMSDSGALLLGGSMDQYSEPLQPLFADVTNPAQLLSPGLSRTMASNAANGIQQQQQREANEFRPTIGDDSDNEDELRRQAAILSGQAPLSQRSASTTSVGAVSSVATISAPAGGKKGSGARSGAPRAGNKKVDVSSMWDTLDPYDQTDIPARPFKRGRTFRKESATADKTLTKSEKKKQKLLSAVEEEPLTKLHKSIGANFLKPVFSEFDYLYERLSRRRAQERRREIEVRRTGVVSADDAVMLQDEADMAEGFDQQAELWVEPIAAGAGFAYEDDDDIGVNFDAASPEPTDGFASSAVVPLENMTYEELCRMHVQKYLKEAEMFQQETDLSRRVADWNHRLEPMLKEQESRPAFDIQGYGGEIIKNFVQAKQTEREEHPAMPFGKLVEVNPVSYEVCRNFTAMLQLINNGNLEIQIHKRPGDDPTTQVHLFSLRLLSEDFESIAETYNGGGHNVEARAWAVEDPNQGGRHAAPTAAASKKRKQPQAKASGKAKGNAEDASDWEEAPSLIRKTSGKKARKLGENSPSEAEEAEFQSRQHLRRLDREEEAEAAQVPKSRAQKKRKGAPTAAPEKENLVSV